MFQPIWAEDAADCVMAALERDAGAQRREFELAGPQKLSYDQIVRIALRSRGRRRRLLHTPMPVVRTSLRALERVTGGTTFATPEEAELMEEAMPSTARDRGRRVARGQSASDECGAGSAVAPPT